VRLAYYAVKAAEAGLNQVILAISFDAYKLLRLFVEFGKNKNYDRFENTRYLLSLM
jgi:hypothetical protein